MLFDRISSGIYGVDHVFDNIRLGDNVVWQVSDIQEYAFFVEPFGLKPLKMDEIWFISDLPNTIRCWKPEVD
jgi:hypothetical protein